MTAKRLRGSITSFLGAGVENSLIKAQASRLSASGISANHLHFQGSTQQPYGIKPASELDNEISSAVHSRKASERLDRSVDDIRRPSSKRGPHFSNNEGSRRQMDMDYQTPQKMITSAESDFNSRRNSSIGQGQHLLPQLNGGFKTENKKSMLIKKDYSLKNEKTRRESSTYAPKRRSFSLGIKDKSRQTVNAHRPSLAVKDKGHHATGVHDDSSSWKGNHNPVSVSGGIEDVNVHPTPATATTSTHKRKRKLNRMEEEKMLQNTTNYRQVLYLEKNTHFDTEEIRALQEMFKIYSNSTKKGTIDRLLFRDILMKTFGITNDEMLNRIYFFFDSDAEGSISDTEWIKNLSIFLRGTMDEHINFVYHIYDINGDASISREELAAVLRNCLLTVPGSDDDPVDGSRELVDLALKNLDVDKTGIITRESFRAAVNNDPLLLQCLGPCLPGEKYLKTFMALISDNYNNYSTNYSHPRDPAYTSTSRVKHPLSKQKLSLKYAADARKRSDP